MTNLIKVLGIESSCDDTGVAIVTENREILSNIVISQNKEHKPFQGVVPEIAARSHLHNLNRAVTSALDESKLSLQQISAIAATSGPGLIGGVIVGSMFGRSLAHALEKPFIAINHLEGHLLTARLTNEVAYPYLLLLVSGGHCQFIAVQNLGQYKILGSTLDDAVGEAFDKVAKMLGLSFPGGPEIEKRALSGDPQKYSLPKPLINHADCNMSFSGLKTAVRLLITKLGTIDQKEINDIAASFQFTVGEVLSVKLLQAIIMYEEIIEQQLQYTRYHPSESSDPELEIRKVYRGKLDSRHSSNDTIFGLQQKNIVIAGGVAANQYLRSLLKAVADKYDYKLIAPPIALCTDNAAMIAYAGLERLEHNLTSPLSFCPRARWSLEEV